jgi:hypothetical protein
VPRQFLLLWGVADRSISNMVRHHCYRRLCILQRMKRRRVSQDLSMLLA